MNYYTSLLQLISRLILLIVIYQICRLFFFLYNQSLFQGVGLREFFGGLRFDLAAIFFSNILVIVLSTIPGNFKYSLKYQKFLKNVFFIINTIFISTNIIDVEYYKFTGKRSTFSLITASGMEGDIMRLIPVFLKNYWFLFLFFIVLLFIFWKLTPTFQHTKNNESGFKGIIIPITGFMLFIGFIVIFGRGGFQRAPIKTVDAVSYTNTSQNTSVVLNTPFTIFRTLNKKDNLKKVNYLNENELNKIYTPIIDLKSYKKFNKKNIVVIILESFGKENINLEFHGKKLTPFLDSLITESLFFDNAYANGLKSIDAVPSVITSIPCLMDISYISSPYSFNKIDGFNSILKEEGYSTSFFHGAFNGSQNFNEFAQISGYNKYYGKNEYLGKDGFDGVWGIFDEEFLQFMANELTTYKQPFFSTVFTISSHNPYTIPEKYINKFPKGDRRILESIAYSDFALKQFFETAKKQPWYKNTVFVLTADHTSRDEKKLPEFNTELGLYSIPILIFDPENPDFKGKNPKLFEQIDILPEILGYLNYTGKIFSFGNSPDNTDRIVANYNEGIYRFIINDYFVNYNGREIIEVFKYKDDSLLTNKITEYPKQEFETKIKSYIQQYNNRMVDNRLFLEKN